MNDGEPRAHALHAASCTGSPPVNGALVTMPIIVCLLACLRDVCSNHRGLVLENAALRQQVDVLRRAGKQPHEAAPNSAVRATPVLGGLHHKYRRAA